MLEQPLPLGACGCRAPPRWRCDVCPESEPHVACSRRCLARHQRQHGVLPPLFDRIVQRQRKANASDNWIPFTPHRDRLARLLCAVQRREGLCVLGAGNGDDLELATLVGAFRSVHLVDLDGEALRRAEARAPGGIVLHELDVTGILATLARSRDGDEALLARASEAPAELAARVGRTFDVVLSSCVVSQLCVPLYGVLARRPAEWASLMAAVGGGHLALMARLTRPGGTGVLLADVPVDMAARGDEVMPLRDPSVLAGLAACPPVAALFEDVRATEPWLWSVEGRPMQVHALLMRRGPE
jgi:hypothetical protein